MRSSIALLLVFSLLAFTTPTYSQINAASSGGGAPAGASEPTAATPSSPGASVASVTTAPGASVPPTARVSVPHTLLDGTAIKLKLAENLTSATAKAGEQVSFEVTEEVDVDGVPVIAKGAQALATVTDAAPKKSMGRGGKLDVNVDSVRLVDGEKAQLRAVEDEKGGGHTGAMTGAMVATAVVFFPAAPLFLFMHGKDITIPEGTEVTAFVQGDMKLDMEKFMPAAPASVAATTAPAPAMAALTIEASLPNCDIEVDGSFVGNTPSTLNLPAGKHDIVVKKTGYQDWKRSMNLASGTIRVSADMVAAQ